MLFIWPHRLVWFSSVQLFGWQTWERDGNTTFLLLSLISFQNYVAKILMWSTSQVLLLYWVELRENLISYGTLKRENIPNLILLDMLKLCLPKPSLKLLKWKLVAVGKLTLPLQLNQLSWIKGDSIWSA